VSMNALLIDSYLVGACAIQWAPRFFQTVYKRRLPALTLTFLPYTYAIMADETGMPFISIPQSNNTMALIGATQRSFDIIVPLCNAT